MATQCPSNVLSTNLCELNPTSCDKTVAATYDHCMENFEHCLIDPAFKLCDKVP
jgi:hypothetical protein